MAPKCSLFLLLLICVFSSGVFGIQLLIVNDCKDTIWPAILGTSGHETPAEGGFMLPTGKQVVIEAPVWWSGRIWGRQDCCFDSTGKGWCLTGDCGGLLHCNGVGGRPPATLVEMTLGTPSNPMHFYDVSLVGGFNLPVSMIPVGGSSGCHVAACETDLNACCPKNLTVVARGKTVGCKSACLATGEYASPKTCRPTVYGNFFKKICPRAYSYAFDEASGLKSCRAKEYVITFCPPN